MRINNQGTVFLDEGDQFIEERQDEANIFRLGTYQVNGGTLVTVRRHFSTIGPIIFKSDGKKMNTEYNRETDSVRELVISDAPG